MAALERKRVDIWGDEANAICEQLNISRPEKPDMAKGSKLSKILQSRRRNPSVSSATDMSRLSSVKPSSKNGDQTSPESLCFFTEFPQENTGSGGHDLTSNDFDNDDTQTSLEADQPDGEAVVNPETRDRDSRPSDVEIDVRNTTDDETDEKASIITFRKAVGGGIIGNHDTNSRTSFCCSGLKRLDPDDDWHSLKSDSNFTENTGNEEWFETSSQDGGYYKPDGDVGVLKGSRTDYYTRESKEETLGSETDSDLYNDVAGKERIIFSEDEYIHHPWLDTTDHHKDELVLS